MRNYLLPLLTSLLLLALLPSTISQPAPLYYEVTNEMASRSMRYHHLIFHNVRNYWNALDKETQDLIASYGWAPPRPAKDAKGNYLENGAGEDFLYMHRTMIGMVNKLLNKYGYPNVTGFTSIPEKDDPEYPMPAMYDAPGGLTNLIRYYKTDEFMVYLKNEEAKLKNETFLRTMTLSELGVYIEWITDVHQGLHFRFSGYNPLMRQRVSEEVPLIDVKYDANTSDWMGDLYASHVNPWFWKVHGWIDDRLTDWQKANNISEIQWNNPWVGGDADMLPENLDISDNPDVDFPDPVTNEDAMDMNNMTNVTTNATEVTNNATDVANNTTDVANNVTDMANVTSNVTDNDTNITNTTDVANNITDVTNAASNITDNTNNSNNNTTNSSSVPAPAPATPNANNNAMNNMIGHAMNMGKQGLLAMEAVGKVLSNKGIRCDYFSDLEVEGGPWGILFKRN